MSNAAVAGVFENYRDDYVNKKHKEMSLQDYLAGCASDPALYASAAERLLKAIGKPVDVDTSKDSRLRRIHNNQIIRTYPAFAEFYGMEESVEAIVSHLEEAAQGLENKKQILYLLGPVGGGKSSLANRLKDLMQANPMYVLQAPDGTISPVNDSPLALFVGDTDSKFRELLQKPKEDGGQFEIPARYFPDTMSPWLAKRLKEANGDISKFKVVQVFPSMLTQLGISSTEPGDENNQDISALVGKIDVRKMERYSQDDPDAYTFSGGLCRANQGLMEFVEMFKAPIKVLHPLLTATQDRHFKGTEDMGAIPFDGVVLAHSNESEWKSFRNNPKNEAFLDRVNIVKVPYCLRVDEEVKIYQKHINGTSLKNAPCAPGTLKLMAAWSVLTRLEDHENSSTVSKMRVYNGEDLKDTDPKAKSMAEYKDNASQDEGMKGSSTRFAHKVLSKVFNYKSKGTGSEIAADPIRLFRVLEKAVKKEQLPKDEEAKRLGYLNYIEGEFRKDIGKEIQTAFIESYAEYGQNIFDRYFTFADYWMQDHEYRDSDTGQSFDRKMLNAELEKIEKPAGISNPKDFRNEIVNFILRWRSGHNNENPPWTSYEKLKNVIEKKMFTNTDEMIPIISFEKKKEGKEAEKHQRFVETMVGRGYTPSQVRNVSDYWLRHRIT